jgi:RNA polymerase sigma-70 factor (ECF subfamily)
VFVVLLQGASRYEPRGSVRSYLFGIAFKLLLADRRRAATGPVVALEHEPPNAVAPDADATLWVRRALGELDSDDRELLMLREYEQLSYQEIADVYRVPLNTVRTRLFRARAALRAALLPEGRGK